MPQFDVHRLGDGLVLDCQSNLLAYLNTRVVVPLIPSDEAPLPARRFNPVFTIGGQTCVMDTQFISSIESRRLGAIICSLAHHSFEISDALDILVSGI